MDAKITKTRLSRLLSYDWLKIVGLAAGLIVVWVLIFTMTATRITAAQQFTAFNYLGNATFSTTKFGTLYSGALSQNVFSYEVIELTSTDLAENPEYASTLMEARVSTDEGDVIFVTELGDASYEVKGENGEISYKYTYLESLVRSYGYYLWDLDLQSETGYFKQMEEFLNAFYQGDWTNEDGLDKAKVEEEFLARIKKAGDKRFKKQSEIEKGLISEIERIEKYRDGLEQFYNYVEKGYVTFTVTSFEDMDTSDGAYYPNAGVYSMNICPTATAGELNKGMSQYVGYYMEETDENGDKHNVRTAENMNVAFFDLLTKTQKQAGFQYENLLFINHLIEQSLVLSGK